MTTASPPETGSAALRDYSNMGRKYNNADPARGAGLSAAVEPGLRLTDSDASVRLDLGQSEREISWSVGTRPFGVR